MSFKFQSNAGMVGLNSRTNVSKFLKRLLNILKQNEFAPKIIRQ
jgi:hypothetical protein